MDREYRRLTANKPVRDWIDNDTDRAMFEISDLCARFKRVEAVAKTLVETGDVENVAIVVGQGKESLSLIQAIDAAPAGRDLAHATLDDLRLRLAAHPDGLFRAACRGGGSALLWTLADRGCVSITALVEDQAPACSTTAVQTNSPAFTVCIDLIQRCPWRVSTKSIGPSTISTIDRSAGAPGCRGAEPGHAVYRLGRRRRRQGQHLLEWQAEVQELAHHPGQDR